MKRAVLSVAIANVFLFGLSARSAAQVAVAAQTDSNRAWIAAEPRRQNAWISGGLGVGNLGLGAVATGWYSNDHLVVGARGAETAMLFGTEVHDGALLIGARNLEDHRLALVAVGPARLGGDYNRAGYYDTRKVPKNEIGLAVAAEVAVFAPIVGIGLDFFAAVSSNRTLLGSTLSIQLGWLGR